MEELLNLYDLKALNSSKMDGYGSINYRIDTQDGKVVLKQYVDHSEFAIVRAEVALLGELEPLLNYHIPNAPIPLKELPDGSLTRLYQFIEGSLLGKAEQTDELLYNFGIAIGQLTQAIGDYRSNPIEARRLEWDQQYCLVNVSKVPCIQHPKHRKWVNYFFDQFAQHIAPIQHELRHAIIHGDVNEQNVLVKGNEVLGIIDFGDICYSPLINEVAVSMAYCSLLNQDDPLGKISLILKGYHSVSPLLPEEVDLLYYLIPIRLCVSVANSSEKQAQGEGTDYIVQNQKDAWNILEQWIGFNPTGVNNYFREALDMPLSNAPGKSTDENPFVEDQQSILNKRRAMIGASLGLSYKSPIHMQSAAFQYMFDAQGNSYLDAYNNIPHIGHCHPLISKVISEKVRKLNTNTRYLYQELTEYAEKLLSYFPPALNKVFFVNSGSEASDLALRIARHYTQRRDIAALESGYHGHSQASMEASAYKYEGRGGFGRQDHILKLPLPGLYRGQFDTAEEYIQDAQSRIEAHASNRLYPAALIAEPISGCGGQVPLAPGYLPGLKPFLEANGILTIMDEVQTGFGRLGEHFWGFQLHGIVPDIVVLGKPMANGHPMGAVVTTTAISDEFANGMEFFSSFGGNPVSCSVGREVLNIIEEEGLQENAKVTGEYYRSELRKLQKDFPVIGDVRGHGLFIGIEFTDSEGEPDTSTAQKIKEGMKKRHILLSTDGPFDNVIKSKPPICFDEKNVDRVISNLRDCLLALS